MRIHRYNAKENVSIFMNNFLSHFNSINSGVEFHINCISVINKLHKILLKLYIKVNISKKNIDPKGHYRTYLNFKTLISRIYEVECKPLFIKSHRFLKYETVYV